MWFPEEVAPVRGRPKERAAAVHEGTRPSSTKQTPSMEDETSTKDEEYSPRRMIKLPCPTGEKLPCSMREKICYTLQEKKSCPTRKKRRRSRPEERSVVPRGDRSEATQGKSSSLGRKGHGHPVRSGPHPRRTKTSTKNEEYSPRRMIKLPCPTGEKLPCSMREREDTPCSAGE
jgi:hypothetical protein